MMNKKWLVPGIIVGTLVLVALTVGGMYNSLVSSRENVNKTLSNVKTQYQRRADLVPNLVNTVKGAANFEKSTFNEVTEKRAKATSTTFDISNATPEQLLQYQAAQGELSQALSRFLAITENYPQLRATEAFRDLQAQLEGTENRIAVARADYNEASNAYNVKVQRVPTSLIAGTFGFEKLPYFEADKGSENAPAVTF
jgi:LemA protein